MGYAAMRQDNLLIQQTPDAHRLSFDARAIAIRPLRGKLLHTNCLRARKYNFVFTSI